MKFKSPGLTKKELEREKRRVSRFLRSAGMRYFRPIKVSKKFKKGGRGAMKQSQKSNQEVKR